MKQQFLGMFFYTLYMLAMIQPIMPLVEYSLNKEYIASVLCENRAKPQLSCNGKCYVQKELKKTQDAPSHQHSIPQIDLSKYPISLIDFKEITFEYEHIVSSRVGSHPQEHPQHYISDLLKPPIV